MEPEENLVIVFEGPVAEADFVRSVLDGNGFDTFVSDEVVGTWLQWYATSTSTVKVAVPESQAEKARALLEHPVNEEGEPHE